jgi:hypothetical protein
VRNLSLVGLRRVRIPPWNLLSLQMIKPRSPTKGEEITLSGVTNKNLRDERFGESLPKDTS